MNNWRTFAQKTTLLEKLFRPKLIRIIKNFRKDFIQDLQAYGQSTAQSNLQQRIADNDLTKTISLIYRKAGLMGAMLTNQELKTAVQKIEKKAANFGRNERWIKDVINYLNTHQIQFVQSITDTMREDILKVLQKAIDEGWGIDKIVMELRSERLVVARARVIARTEIIRAANVGHSVAAKSFPYEVDKKWSSAKDHRTRHSHQLINNRQVEENGFFKVPIYKGDKPTGRFDEMLYPGDPEASASNTVNCFLPDELTSVNPAIIQKAIRSRYEGEVVTIQTTSERKFTCTPNHPILTTVGWVKAGNLTSSHNLVKSEFVELYTSVNFNVKDKPTTFEQLYNSFASSCVGMRVIGSIVNFHGDKPTGYVDIIDPNRKLRNWVKLFFFQSYRNQVFNDSYFGKCFGFCKSVFSVNRMKVCSRFISNGLVSLSNNISSLLGIRLSHSQLHGFTPISRGNISFSQGSIDNISTNTMLHSELFNANAGTKFINDNITRKEFLYSSELMTGQSEVLVHKRNATAENVCDIINGLSTIVQSDGVLSVERNLFHGNVYNLETDVQMYDINGYVAHNCRCRVLYIPKRDSNGGLIMRRENQATVIPMRRNPTQRDIETIAAELKAALTFTIE